MEQRTEEWFKARTGMITGSRAGAILGLAPYQQRHDVLRAMVREYHGAESEFKGNIATKYGNRNEQNALEMFKLHTRSKVEEVGFLKHPIVEWLGASPDGLVDDDAVLEIKCPFGLRNDEKPKFKSIYGQPHYFAQVQIEMACAERYKCYFFQWSPFGYRLELVNFDPDWFEDALPALEQFYNLYQYELKNEAHLAPSEICIQDDALAIEYEHALEQYEKAKDALDAAKSKLIEKASGHEKCFVSGVRVQRIKRKGNINYKNVPELLGVDLEQYRNADSTFWKVG